MTITSQGTPRGRNTPPSTPRQTTPPSITQNETHDPPFPQYFGDPDNPAETPEGRSLHEIQRSFLLLNIDGEKINLRDPPPAAGTRSGESGHRRLGSLIGFQINFQQKLICAPSMQDTPINTTPSSQLNSSPRPSLLPPFPDVQSDLSSNDSWREITVPHSEIRTCIDEWGSKWEQKEPVSTKHNILWWLFLSLLCPPCVIMVFLGIRDKLARNPLSRKEIADMLFCVNQIREADTQKRENKVPDALCRLILNNYKPRCLLSGSNASNDLYKKLCARTATYNNIWNYIIQPREGGYHQPLRNNGKALFYAIHKALTSYRLTHPSEQAST